MIFLRHHLDEGVKVEYLTVKDPFELWIDLKERYDHLKTTVLPRVSYEWMYLQFQDFKIVVQYNSVVFKIVSQMKLCGKTINDENMMKKILTTFHASNVILQQQYREKGFQKYSELIYCLLVVEQHNTLLMKNHEVRLTGVASLPEANGVQAHGQPERRQDRGHNNMRGRGNGRGQYKSILFFGDSNQRRENQMSPQNNPSRGNCHRCGMKGHWKNECRTPKHFARLYQESCKRKRNEGETSSNARMESYLTFKNDDEAGPSQKYDDNVEANLFLKDDDFYGIHDITHLEAKDFFGDQN
ncbi:uncharacterized protein LOC107873852 [Capsicum annuum]|uniref:uncharacterized protein LOC107873852 n=1 Tax=Capsicum annuum TaxID=4072 RepID=UPI001FB0BF2D|nr:uncharacterized protein LOC107873852 [Capsicum annuum]